MLVHLISTHYHITAPILSCLTTIKSKRLSFWCLKTRFINKLPGLSAFAERKDIFETYTNAMGIFGITTKCIQAGAYSKRIKTVTGDELMRTSSARTQSTPTSWASSPAQYP
jgi:hypothetical protein